MSYRGRRRFCRRFGHWRCVGTGSHRRRLFTVPFLTWCNVRVQNAIGTSAAIGFPIAIGSSLGCIILAGAMPTFRPGAWDWYLPALVWMVPASMLIAPLGARLAHRLPVSTLKRIFACVLIALAAKMLWSFFLI